jgi:hypothetical protein
VTEELLQDPLFAQAYRRALDLTGPKLAAYLKDELGRPLVARVTNVRFANTVTRWTRGVQPNRHALNRMQLVATLIFALEPSFAERGGAVRWLALDNPGLGFRAPIDALGEGAFADVFAAARSYVTPAGPARIAARLARERAVPPAPHRSRDPR